MGTLGTWGLGAQPSGFVGSESLHIPLNTARGNSWPDLARLLKVVEAQVAKPHHNWAAMRAAGDRGVGMGWKEFVTPIPLTKRWAGGSWSTMAARLRPATEEDSFRLRAWH